MENNRECQHCDASHPELVTAYFPFFGYSEDDITPRLRPVFDRYQAAAARPGRVCGSNGVPRDARRELDTRPTGFQICACRWTATGHQLRHRRRPGVQEADGRRRPTPKFGDLSLHMQPNSWFHFLSDHAVVFRVLPMSADKSIVRTTWLVHPDAVEGVDYDVESLTAVWQATNDQDRELVEKHPARRHQPRLRARALLPGRGRRRGVRQLVRHDAFRDYLDAEPRARRRSAVSTPSRTSQSHHLISGSRRRRPPRHPRPRPAPESPDCWGGRGPDRRWCARAVTRRHPRRQELHVRARGRAGLPLRAGPVHHPACSRSTASR